jgi:molybdopterin converting factor subunit 1
MKVLLFARARDLIGADCIDAADAATVGELRRHLMQRFPNAAGLLQKSAFALDNELADDAAAISPGAEVALLPPVSGG